MNLFQASLAKLAASAVQSVAQRQADRAPVSRSKASSCTPCAAHAYVDKVRKQVGGLQGKRR